MPGIRHSLVLLAAMVAGCSCRPAGVSLGDGAGRLHPPPTAPLGTGDGPAGTAKPPPEVVSLTYYDWGRSSPGGGFTRSEGRAIEIDFVRHRVRSIIDLAKAPEPMRPPMNLLWRQLWADLPPKREAEIRRALAAWLATGPLRECLLMRSLGREGGHTARLVVQTAAGDYTVHINPPGKARDELDCAPGPAYRPLIDQLFYPD